MMVLTILGMFLMTSSAVDAVDLFTSWMLSSFSPKGPLGMPFLIPSPAGNYGARRIFSVSCRGPWKNPPVSPNIHESKQSLSQT
jgi:hypothetical protein